MRIYLQSLENLGAPKFCQLILQKDLLGGWSLVIETGNQGSPGRVKRTFFEERSDAEHALQVYRDKQIKKGMRVVFVEGQTQTDP